MTTYETESGLVLHIKPVSTGAVQSLLGSSDVLLGMFSNMEDFQDLSDVTEQETIAMLREFEPLANYCIGWGVTDDPPKEAMVELDILGVKPRGKREARIKWLRLLVLDQEDMGRLVGRILALSMSGEGEAEPEG